MDDNAIPPAWPNPLLAFLCRIVRQIIGGFLFITDLQFTKTVKKECVASTTQR